MPEADLGIHFARTGREVSVWQAFPGRRPLAPWFGCTPVPDAEQSDRYAASLRGPVLPRKRLAYVHVPFCANHCLFCAFYRSPAHADAMEGYASLPIAELVGECESPAVALAPVHAVYLGGGTPTALAEADLARLLETLTRRLPLAPDCEISVEGRVLHFDSGKIDACLEAGANRFSIGVQSFDTRVRRAQGRRASREELIRFLESVRDRDRATLVLDLLIGLPGQTPDVFERDLDACVGLEPDGVDLYPLNLFANSPLHRAIAAGKLAPGAPLPEIGALYARGVERLRRAGWRQISNTHFARTTRERNLYNLLIKQGADCLAYGAGAGGSLGDVRYSIEPDPGRYADAVEAGRKPLAGVSEAGPHRRLFDVVVGGLEQGRLDLARVDPLAPALVQPLIAQWHAAGLLHDADCVLRLTIAGRFWATNLARSLVDVLSGGQTSIGTEPFPVRRTSPPITRRMTA